MKIRVIPQMWYREHGWGDDPTPVYFVPDSPFWRENYFISIRNVFEQNENCAIPLSGDRILKLQFDDAVSDSSGTLRLFDEVMAGQIADFAKKIDGRGELFINCLAGVSRSGAVGEVLNTYFNVYCGYNMLDDFYFRHYNAQIQPNPRVRQLLGDALFIEADISTKQP